MENKKSFILYADLISMVEQLPDEMAGRLLKTILEYVNDRNPEPNDMLLKIAFEPIKQQLKRDLVKWREFREKQRQNGMLGGRPSKPKKPKPLSGNPTKPTETQKSLNANVNVNVSVNDKEREVPTWEIFSAYAKEKSPLIDLKTLKLKYDAWVVNDWKTGKDNPIKNWKSTLLQTLPHLPVAKETTW